MKQKLVLLVGEHSLLRAFLRAWLSRFDDLRIGAESSDALHAVTLVAKHKPALVLMDFDTLQGSSLNVLSKIRNAYPDVKVIIYFAYANDQVAFNVMRAGAAGFVVKDAHGDDMETAIRTVLAGGVYLSAQFLKSVGSAEEGRAGEAVLSRRQSEILKLIALGNSTKEVAYKLKISSKTVDVHKQALMGRIGVRSVADLVKYAIRCGLVPA